MNRKLMAYFIFFLFSIFIMLLWNTSVAQCAMCRAVAESAQEENSIRQGLNSGILYLLAVPYGLIVGFAVYFFRKPISEKWRALKK